MEKILKYSQEDVDNIVEKVKNSYAAKVEETHVSREVYNEMVAKWENLNGEVGKRNFKDVFLKSGGSEGCFEDFYKLEEEKIKQLDGKYEKYLEEAQRDKVWAFEKQSVMPSDESVMKDMMKNDLTDLIPGTIYKKEE